MLFRQFSEPEEKIIEIATGEPAEGRSGSEVENCGYARRRG